MMQWFSSMMLLEFFVRWMNDGVGIGSRDGLVYLVRVLILCSWLFVMLIRGWMWMLILLVMIEVCSLVFSFSCFIIFVCMLFLNSM